MRRHRSWMMLNPSSALTACDFRPSAGRATQWLEQNPQPGQRPSRLTSAPRDSNNEKIQKLLLLGFFTMLASCGCETGHVGTVYSPDRKHKAVLEQSQGAPGMCFTSVHVMSAPPMEASTVTDPIAGFEAPYDYKQLKIRWISNDTLQASYPGFRPGEFPRSSFRSGDEIKFEFPK